MRNILYIDAMNDCECSLVSRVNDGSNLLVLNIHVDVSKNPQLEINSKNIPLSVTDWVYVVPPALYVGTDSLQFRIIDNDHIGNYFSIIKVQSINGNLYIAQKSNFEYEFRTAKDNSLSGIQSSSDDGGHSNVQCTGGELQLNASENLLINGTNWNDFLKKHPYDWSTFETENTSNTWMPVINGKSVFHRNVAATFKQANHWDSGTDRWTCLRLSNDIALLFVKGTSATSVNITTAAAKGYASREYTCGLPSAIKTILYANSYVENNYNWENVELKIHSISTTAIKSHFWCQNSYKGLNLWWCYMLVAQM